MISTRTVTGLPPLSTLLCARLATAGDGGSTPRSEARRAVAPWLEIDGAGGSLAERFEALVDSESAAGRLRLDGRGRLTLTDEGTVHVRSLPGLEEPGRARAWRFVKDVSVVAHALGVRFQGPESMRRFASADGLRAAVLRACEGLDALSATPTLPQARDALLWKWLAARSPVDARAESRKPFGRGAVVGVILADLLGRSERIDPARGLRQLAARAVGARRPDASELRFAVIRRWIEAGESDRANESAPAAVRTAASAGDAAALEAFATGVLDLARVAPEESRFGSGKVFISELWRRWRDEGREPSLDEREFKARLVEANRERLLDLSRADLVSVMDPELVAASETHDDDASFHFVRLPELVP